MYEFCMYSVYITLYAKNQIRVKLILERIDVLMNVLKHLENILQEFDSFLQITF